MGWRGGLAVAQAALLHCGCCGRRLRWLLAGCRPRCPTACWRAGWRRLLRRLTVEDAAEASHVFSLLMGDKVAPRRQLIEEEGSRLALADLDY